MKLKLRAVRAEEAEIHDFNKVVRSDVSPPAWSPFISFATDTYLRARPYGICTSPSIVERSVLLSKLCTEEALRSWASGST